MGFKRSKFIARDRDRVQAQLSSVCNTSSMESVLASSMRFRICCAEMSSGVCCCCCAMFSHISSSGMQAMLCHLPSAVCLLPSAIFVGLFLLVVCTGAQVACRMRWMSSVLIPFKQ